jgi:hypothetical protein
MKKRNVVIVLLIIIFSLIIIGFSINLISSPIRRNYTMQLTTEFFSGSDIMIDLPKNWVVFDVVELDRGRDEKESDERYLLVTGSYFGGFPHIEIYGVEIGDIEYKGNDYEKISAWNKIRLQKEESENRIIFNTTSNYKNGQLMTYIIDVPTMDQYPREKCKDWLYIKANIGYLVSICETEDNWDKLNLIYSEIIESFEVTTK